MAKNVGLMLVAGVLVCLVLAAPATAAVTCGVVAQSVVGCLSFVRSGGRGAPAAPCCNGIRNLNAMAATTPDRQAACRCLKNLASGMGSSLNPGVISTLPSRCGVSVPYAISAKTDCSKIR